VVNNAAVAVAATTTTTGDDNHRPNPKFLWKERALNSMAVAVAVRHQGQSNRI